MEKHKEKGILVVVSGFSGAGKGTIMKNLTQKYDNYALSISATTRAARPGEEEGKSYFFVSKDRFEEMIDRDELVEYAKYVTIITERPESSWRIALPKERMSFWR